ncbi:three-Cys-motif partner protein TcmP [Dehalogenimonas sp. 4OHTPN]|uniref:Three-Cys-motif partner protein TcmP n=1 Tax=Dehalogenimonas sp. 4OHTPN TaxID=3166643 RepID=A0AAU8GAJ7_9CHLR
MGLEFEQDAICLSGLTGSKLKCEVLGQYYPFWWGITSGGPAVGHKYLTGIVELDAATGEVFIEDTGETVLGSSGHALALKASNANAYNLKIVLVEKNPICFDHLKKVIQRRWKSINTNAAEGSISSNGTGVYLLNKSLDDALQDISHISLGNALFFFDPLRSAEYSTIEQVARARIASYYRTGTEMIVFLFTSDWFLGRGDFKGLPTGLDPNQWSDAEQKAVLEADALLGTVQWRNQILNANPIHEREQAFVEFYRQRLHRWFRYVLPMPFNPKTNQIFHLILCSNYEVGVRATREFYCNVTGNPKYTPDNKTAFDRFRKAHPDLFIGLSGTKRPSEWKILWRIITEHEEGICDNLCSDFSDIGATPNDRQGMLEWLEHVGYIRKIPNNNAWGALVPLYQINWPYTTDRLQVDPPAQFKPISLKLLSMEDINIK